jgi:hypothetical protein
MLEYLTIIWNRLLELMETPRHTPEMLWFLIPLIATLFVIEFYFGRYRQERMGWNTAIENNLVLLFVALDLLRHLSSAGTEITQFNARLTMAVVIGVIAVLFIILEFFHAISEKFAFMISSHFVINLIAVFVVIIVYSTVPIDIPTMVVVLALIALITFFAEYIHYIIPKFVDVEKLKLQRLEDRLTHVKEAPIKGDQYGVVKDADVVSVGKKKAVVAVPSEWTGGEVNVVLTKEPSVEKSK